MGRDRTGREVGGGLESAGRTGVAGKEEPTSETGAEPEATPRADEEGLGAAASGTPHPLEATTPITPHDAARLMLAYPNHPVTKAFFDYINNNTLPKKNRALIDTMLRRMPPYYPPDGMLWRGIGKLSEAEQAKLVEDYAPGQSTSLQKVMNSGSKDPAVALRFAQQDGQKGIVLEVVQVGQSARNIEPIAQALSHQYRFQREVTFLKGTTFVFGPHRIVNGIPVIEAKVVP
jgi:hypothetical protein